MNEMFDKELFVTYNKLEEAIEVVLELARKNILTESQAWENDLEGDVSEFGIETKEKNKQFDACGVIEDFFVNVVSKDEEE